MTGISFRGAKSLRWKVKNSHYSSLCNSQQLTQPPLALAVPLSRFTSRVGGGSAFYVRRNRAAMFKSFTKAKPNPDRWPKYVMGSPVCRWTSSDGKERVYLVARNDGGFTSGSEYFSDAEFEHCWCPVGTSGSIYGSEEIAVREIHAAFPWSRDVKREDYA